ncbi:MAG TPA: FkbM family methyltransferase [Candidatus Dojkabacteria bacterium]|nr:FkbM family methyltransferase [Candidatus Dojkabacteria bacterium]
MESTKLGKYTVLYPNKKEYHTLKREIWNQEIYYFKTDTNCPYIVDIGSHIGISIIYFKALYPNCKILAFEPNPISFEILKENIFNNGLEDIQLINKAISSDSPLKDFYIDNSKQNWESNSSFLKNSWSGKESTKSIKVECTRLDEYIKDIQKIDMLKIDTEGSEYEILNSHKNILNKVKNISVEYHPVKNSKIEKILIVLREYFDIKIFFEGEEIKNMVNDKLLTIKGEKRV